MQNDGKGKLKEAYVVGFEMLPEDMESFFMNGEDYGGFRSTFRFYSVDSFFEDSKFNRVGKTGDCGTGTTGGNYSGDIGYNSPGTVLSHNYNGNNITTSFSYNTVSTTYYYNSTIVSNGTVSTVSTEATSGVVEVATNGPTAPVYTTYVPNGTTQVNVSYEAPNSSGPGATTEPCTSTHTVGPDGTWSGSLCATPSTNQNKSRITAYGDDCVSGSGTFAINTAAKPIHKLYYALNGSFTAGHFNWFTDPDHTERVDIAKEFVWFLIDNGNTEENINFVLTSISALMDRGIYDRLLAAMSPKERGIYDNELDNTQKTLYLTSAVQAYIYAETFYDQPVRNRIGDAVKHSMWNALSASRIGVALTKKLTDAHEDIAYDPNYQNHYKETQMDYFNNSVGRNIGKDKPSRIFVLIEAAKNAGELRYLSNLTYKNGFYNATNNSILIPTNQ
ncbi:hypothetical protein PP182_19390 [Maribacter sp. PR1]|uniref:DUF6973 domain-containing protein n=1 Tax=Maribacter cobaltidurans TaxID=1178778 RepID=A0ABU7IZ33_9FLAO|nr:MULTISPECIES: hypothetical protein [Maribacter]MDC6390858.1 hypothetical protein [Maribacter sp. PR1]MEE1978250.1 hypothetical protein [Maribacter cobaltidurans]